MLRALCWSCSGCVMVLSLAFRQSAGLQSYCRPTYHCGVIKKQSHMHASDCMKYCILSLCEGLSSYHISSCSNCRLMTENATAIFQGKSSMFVFFLAVYSIQTGLKDRTKPILRLTNVYIQLLL